MILSLLRRRPADPTITALYGAIVAQARAPGFYLDYGVPDTLEGRFDMIVLHVFLVTRRLKGEPDLAAVGQALFDRFCRDLDDNLREMGVSDLAVPRKMRDFAGAYYGRAQVYDRALADGGDALATALSRNVFAAGGLAPGSRRLADYMTVAAHMLDATTAAEFAAGDLHFPAPEAIAAVSTRLNQPTSSDGSTFIRQG